MNQRPALMISENFENRSNRICPSDYISPLFYCPIKMIRRTVPMIPITSDLVCLYVIKYVKR